MEKARPKGPPLLFGAAIMMMFLLFHIANFSCKNTFLQHVLIYNKSEVSYVPHGMKRLRFNLSAMGTTTSTYLQTESGFTSPDSVEDEASITRPKLGYIIDTPGCKIPQLDPYDPSVKGMIRDAKFECLPVPKLTYIQNNWLKINMSVLKDLDRKGLSHCQYEEIIPVEGGAEYGYKPGGTLYQNGTKISAEYIQVTCYGKSSALLQTNFHAIIQEKKHVEIQCERKYKEFTQTFRPKEKLNVLLLGIDSVSRANFHRHMLNTSKYLLEELGAIEMKGYNKIADNTIPNLCALLAGEFRADLEEACKKNKTHPKCETYDIIWDDFAQKGYRTFLAEDWPYWQMFKYPNRGFRKPLVNHMYRPFSRVLEREREMWNSDHHCFGSKLETEMTLDFLDDFLTKSQSKPHFAFTFIARLTHGNWNKIQNADRPYSEFLEKLNKRNYFNNSVVIFFSDHGIRFGAIRRTYSGVLEERLPMMFLIFPKWFHTKYPEMSANLKRNANRLVTLFDVNKLLSDVLYFKGLVKKSDVSQRGISLFSNIPAERTCEDAGIHPHWCCCHDRKQISTNNTIIQKAAQILLNNINRRFANATMCVKLGLAEITSVYGTMLKQETMKVQMRMLGMKEFKLKAVEEEYLIQFKTKPGDGVFEGTVVYTNTSKEFMVTGDISRINLYGNQSACVDDLKMRKFCFCREL